MPLQALPASDNWLRATLASRHVGEAPASTIHMPSLQERKLQKAAAEFESILLSTFWKSMKSAFAESDEDASDPAHETLDDFGIQAMSNAMGKAGGLGLGKLILKQLEPLLHRDDSSKNSQSQ